MRPQTTVMSLHHIHHMCNVVTDNRLRSVIGGRIRCKHLANVYEFRVHVY